MIPDQKSGYIVVFITILITSFVRSNNEFPLSSPEDFKCALPDVTITDEKLDVIRFRSDFSKISEVKFPGLIGPLSERLFCKIKCIDGNWVGPLCANTPDGRFQPVLRECLYQNDQPLLAISFKNATIDKETRFPHGSIIVVRCKHFGFYKLKGENTLNCENGEWTPKFPECVPTTVVTNFTGESPPTIQYVVVRGSAAVAADGQLLVFPDSSLSLDCRWQRARGDPDWSWTQSRATHPAAWSTEESEKDSHFRLSLEKLSPRHSDRYTCTTPAGRTNTLTLRVVSVVCSPLGSARAPLRLHAQGSRLGNVARFSCQAGHHLQGAARVTCGPDGQWSAPVPVCSRTRCPARRAVAHGAWLEMDARAGGRAVAACSWGYRLHGAPGAECLPHGVWSAPMPVCLPITCLWPPAPAHAELRGAGRRVGDLLAFACERGFEPRGETSIVCTENGFWSHPPPSCVPTSSASPPPSAVAALRAVAATPSPHSITIDNLTLLLAPGE